MVNSASGPAIFAKNKLQMKRLLQLTALIFLFMACNNSGTNNNKTAKTHSDSLMDEVMEGHNAGMAKMSRMHEAQKKLEQTVDSISKLPAASQKNLAAYKMQVDSVINRLKYADYAMNKWMEEFNMDSASDNEDKRVEYLGSEKIKISKVKDAMTGSLQKADSLLRQKF
jgi:hypothetical protein